MLTIHGVTRSRASRIIWLCHELDLPFKQVPVIQAYRLANPDAPDAPLNTHSESFLKLSPAGAIPVLQDGDLVLSESFACTLHLARKYGQPLGPGDAIEDALILQWSFYAATSIEEDALTILSNLGKGSPRPPEAEKAISQAAERLLRPFKVLDDHIARHGHMVGGRFTVADLNLAEVVRYAQGHAGLMGRFPALKVWLEACQSRPAFQKMWQARLDEPA
ncbi:glutathione S-transferase family protein [Paracoccus sp. J56]|uniref:glutathione S-transferase family protein n=1 Tax=Paracoccus sp. J56 TaxID=935850 RepID=UPI000A09B106|nr:glutathione S-transferase family protein [Paracoccus sp. J56]SMG05545.1 glutathione S-transferase [Paracoccus sp. J56]